MTSHDEIVAKLRHGQGLFTLESEYPLLAIPVGLGLALAASSSYPEALIGLMHSFLLG